MLRNKPTLATKTKGNGENSYINRFDPEAIDWLLFTICTAVASGATVIQSDYYYIMILIS